MQRIKTLVIVKPNAVERGLVGVFLERFERIGLRILQIKVLNEAEDFWNRFYPSDEEWLRNVGRKTLENCEIRKIDVEEKFGTSDPKAIGQSVKQWLVRNMASGPSVAVLLGGNEICYKVRAACGATLPNVAQPGTIRFDFSSDSPAAANAEERPVDNLIHASDPEEMRGDIDAVEYEIKLVFPEYSN